MITVQKTSNVTGGGTGKTLGKLGGLAGGIIGGVYGGPKGALAGFNTGKGVGSTVGNVVDPVKENVSQNIPMQDSPMSRRMEAIQEDPHEQLKTGFMALMDAPDEIRKEYSPQFIQAYQASLRERGLV